MVGATVAGIRWGEMTFTASIVISTLSKLFRLFRNECQHFHVFIDVKQHCKQCTQCLPETAAQPFDLL